MNIRFAKIFNWTPVAVERPVPFYQDYEDAGHMLIRYDVKVTYLYHGEKEVFFDLVDERLWVNETSPRQAANNYFNKMLQKMNAQKQMLKNHNENTK